MIRTLPEAAAGCHNGSGGSATDPDGARDSGADRSLMTIRDELQRRRAAVLAQLDPGDRQVIADGIERVRMLQVAETSLAAGDTLPDFELADAAGRVHRSRDLLAKGPLVLSFFRGAWCPYCDIAMRALETVRPRLEALGASVVGVIPTRGEELAHLAEERHLRYPMLVDVGERYARLCGVHFEVADDHVAFYRRLGIDLPTQHAGAGWELPLPATYVVRPDGTISFAFADADWVRRAEPDDVVEAVRRCAQAAAGEAGPG